MEPNVINQQVVFDKEFHIYGSPDHPLFRATEVAEWIEHTNVSSMLSCVDEEERELHKQSTLNNVYSAWFLTEDGLYEVLMQSRKPIAKEFKKKVKEILKSIRQNGGYIVPQSQGLEFLQGMLDQMKQQNAEIRQAKEQSQKAIEATQSIRSAIVEEYDDWREDIKHKISVIQKGMNETYQNTYNKLYDVLESRAACDLSARVRNGRKRLEESGATKTKVEDYCRMDAIESDTRLKEIFTAIVREYAVKYVA